MKIATITETDTGVAKQFRQLINRLVFVRRCLEHG